MRKLTKVQKTLTAIIECEGARILAHRSGSNHLAVDYTFDGTHHFTQHLPYGRDISRRWEANFRSAIRKTKPTTKDPR